MQAIRLLNPPARRWIVIIALALLAGCSIQPVEHRAPASTMQAAQLYQSGRYADAARMYQQLAANAPAPQRASLLLRAGEAWVKAGNQEAALEALNAIPAGALADADATHRLLLTARLDLATQRPQAALAVLRTLNAPPSSETHSTILQLRGQALFALNEPVAAVDALAKRASLLQDPTAQAANRQTIWRGLTQARQSLTAAGASRNPDPIVAGWLALGEIGRTAWQAPYRFQKRIAAWQRQYPDHPANGSFVQQLLQQHAQRTAYPDRIAVLLPLSGPQAGLAAAIRDGLLAAHWSRGTRQTADAAAPLIRLYDTHDSPQGAVAAYQQAMADGAKAVIGPLRQDALEALASAGAIAVPTLALTNLPGQPAAGANLAPRSDLFDHAAANAQPSAHPYLYQFGFDPVDEAREAAERAVQDGRARGVALAPDTPHGHRMIDAFRQHLEALGGDLLDTGWFKPGETNVAAQIKQVLNLNLSEARAQTLQSVLGRNVDFTPRRREDVQFIFLIADNGEARLIRPQIRFHHGIGLPIYATSEIYQPNSDGEFDLNGVMFMDLPWLLSDDNAIAAVRKQLEHLWPRRYDAAARWYALGYDAWRLVPLIVHLSDPLATPVRGVTGILTIGPEQRIHREYDWAKFQRGKIDALAPAGE
ncbi:MAG TPA: penicillin-binding protein activator [Gammaproteobacteria bacterium]|nr:penicillin-binding protein activator [Gammaproteobacteria bacterium]